MNQFPLASPWHFVKSGFHCIYINCLKTEWQLNRIWAANIHNKKYILHEMDTSKDHLLFSLNDCISFTANLNSPPVSKKKSIAHQLTGYKLNSN